jgi:arylsulfatase A-like enzyme
MLRHVKGMKEVYRNRSHHLNAAIDNTIDVLSRHNGNRPFCAYLYAFDPHLPYDPPHQFDFGQSDTDRYDGEIAYTDFCFGKLFDWVEKSGHMKDTMIVVMADHGESLGERRVNKHSTQLYDEQTHVPMIVYAPGIAPRRVGAYVSTVDLGPTILNFVGLDYPEAYAGVSLVPLMKGEPMVHPPVYSEQTFFEGSRFVSASQQINQPSKKYMVITQDGFKLIYNRDFYAFELYDLKKDPLERRNLFEQFPARAARMKALVGTYVDVVRVSRPWNADESKYRFAANGASAAASANGDD